MNCPRCDSHESVDITIRNDQAECRRAYLCPRCSYRWQASNEPALRSGLFCALAERVEMILSDLTITIRADMTAYNRSLDRARRAISQLRYPPKAPARGGTGRRREKLHLAGIDPRKPRR